MEKDNIYIPSIDAKDIYLASHSITESGKQYSLKQRMVPPENSSKAPAKNGQYNLKKFNSTLDYSLDLIQLNNIYHKKYRRNDFSFTLNGKKYSTKMINVTFLYSVKEWNQADKNTYVRFGYHTGDLTFHDCIARNDKNEIVGIRLEKPVKHPLKDFCDYFSCTTIEGCNAIPSQTQFQYRKVKEPKTVKTSHELRTELYENGFLCDDAKYVRCKRSAGSARVGKCLFIEESLAGPLQKYSSGAITLKTGQEVDLAAYESYLALTASSIIDTLPIKAENILVINDYESTFTEEVIATRSADGWLSTKKETVEISNSIWDGQSLMDFSLFGDYKDYGMVLLRNLMFKSCCFNCNIQQWFKDHHITDISQLNGITRARRIGDIKLITTPSSIKYLKFDTLDHWFDHLYPEFGVVKHDKKTHFFDGELVQTHYQLINTLQLSEEEIREFLKPALDFAQKLRDNSAVVRYYIKYPNPDEAALISQPVLSKNDVVFHLMCINDQFTDTKYYQSFLTDLLRSYYKNLKNGHVLVHGNYSTLLGNPIEMLKQSIGQFDGQTQIGIGSIHSTRFPYGKTLLASRSPHVTMGNIWLPYNTENELIDRYINMTDEIVCINSIGENVLQRLSGADFDSDAVLLTDNEVLIEAAKRNYSVFKTPTSFVAAKKVKRYYTPEQQADLDIKTSVNLIGEIINLSQELNSLLWDRMYHGSSYQEVEGLYFDICQLDVMSGIEIDKAKKEFDVNNRKELEAIRKKYSNYLTDEYNRKKIPHFLAHIAKQKGYYFPEKKNYSSYHTSMDYLQMAVNGFRIKNSYKKKWLPFVSILDRRKYYTSHVNTAQIARIYEYVQSYLTESKGIYGSEHSKEDKYRQYCICKERFVKTIQDEKIGFSTLYHLLSSMENEDTAPMKNTLLPALFQSQNRSFLEAILSSKQELEYLVRGGNDIYLFGLGFSVKKPYKRAQK